MTDNSSHDWPWSQLEIAPTPDKNQIKAAYARILKRDRVHGDPEKFQALREARDFAMALDTELHDEHEVVGAEEHKKDEEVSQQENSEQDNPDGKISVTLPMYGSFILNEYTTDQVEYDASEQEGPPSLPEGVEEQVAAFLANPWIRTLVQEWQVFFDELPLLSEAANFMLESRIANAVDDWFDGMHNYPTLDVLEYLFDHFQWNSVDSKLPFFLGELRIRRLKTVMSGYRMVI